MGEPILGGSVEPAAVHRCYYCGTERPSSVRYCAECKRYQPASAGAPEWTVSNCRVCGELIPGNAVKCTHCSAFQRGIGSWLPTSSATISALGALVALVILLIDTIAAHPPARSHTSLALVNYDPEHLFVRVSNSGTMPSFVNTGWFTLASASACPPAPCPEPGAGPKEGFLKLEAHHVQGLQASMDAALIDPGHKVMDFILASHFNQTTHKLPIGCDSFKGDKLRQVKVCLAFEVSEHQNSTSQCVPLQLSNLSETHFLQFVEQAVATSCQD